MLLRTFMDRAVKATSRDDHLCDFVPTALCVRCFKSFNWTSSWRIDFIRLKYLTCSVIHWSLSLKLQTG